MRKEKNRKGEIRKTKNKYKDKCPAEILKTEKKLIVKGQSDAFRWVKGRASVCKSFCLRASFDIVTAVDGNGRGTAEVLVGTTSFGLLSSEDEWTGD